MKASELRIGNLLLFSNMIEPDRIVCVDAWFLRQLVSSNKIKDPELNGYYHPIPLTPEILEKMGFPYLQNACWHYGNMRIYNISDDRPRFRITLAGHELVILSYVHQLQNFHHLFTGKELEFTL